MYVHVKHFSLQLSWRNSQSVYSVLLTPAIYYIVI